MALAPFDRVRDNSAAQGKLDRFIDFADADARPCGPVVIPNGSPLAPNPGVTPPVNSTIVDAPAPAGNTRPAATTSTAAHPTRPRSARALPRDPLNVPLTPRMGGRMVSLR